MADTCALTRRLLDFSIRRRPAKRKLTPRESGPEGDMDAPIAAFGGVDGRWTCPMWGLPTFWTKILVAARARVFFAAPFRHCVFDWPPPPQTQWAMSSGTATTSATAIESGILHFGGSQLSAAQLLKSRTRGSDKK